jgi:hypothetical protein
VQVVNHRVGSLRMKDGDVCRRAAFETGESVGIRVIDKEYLSDGLDVRI